MDCKLSTVESWQKVFLPISQINRLTGQFPDKSLTPRIIFLILKFW